MVEHDNSDFGSTTAVIAYVRRRITPAVLWSAIGTLITALGVAITWLINTQGDIHRLKESVIEARAEHQQDSEVLHKIDTHLAVIDSKMDNIAEEMDSVNRWRDRIEDVADSPPHARRRR